MKTVTNKTQPRYTIRLFQTPTGWSARYDDPKIIELFGTDVLPTAYTPRADSVFVQQEISALNPDCNVILY